MQHVLLPAHAVAAAPANRHYERLGGHAAVQRLVLAFYDAMNTRDDAKTIRAMHAADLGLTQEVLVKYLSEWMGGPKHYTPERGTPMLRRRHQPFDIDSRARDAWMACMRQALAATCADESLRAELDAAFYKVADFIRNTETGGAPRAHPGRPRETLAQPAAAAPHTSQADSTPRSPA